MAHDELDVLMERASEALAEMDYRQCEALCLDALAQARQQGDWPFYARVLLPLQESRRQRRMIAADGGIRLGTGSMEGELDDLLDAIGDGCVVLTRPHDAAAARALADAAALRKRCVLLLLADNEADAAVWNIRSFRGPDVACDRPAPANELVDRWWPGQTDKIQSDRTAKKASEQQVNRAGQAADWFLSAAEALGDAALAKVAANLRGRGQVEALEKCLQVVTDHEILHQRLGEAAREAGRQTKQAS